MGELHNGPVHGLSPRPSAHTDAASAHTDAVSAHADAHSDLSDDACVADNRPRRCHLMRNACRGCRGLRRAAVEGRGTLRKQQQGEEG